MQKKKSLIKNKYQFRCVEVKNSSLANYSERGSDTGYAYIRTTKKKQLPLSFSRR